MTKHSLASDAVKSHMILQIAGLKIKTADRAIK